MKSDKKSDKENGHEIGLKIRPEIGHEIGHQIGHQIGQEIGRKIFLAIGAWNRLRLIYNKWRVKTPGNPIMFANCNSKNTSETGLYIH